MNHAYDGVKFKRLDSGLIYVAHSMSFEAVPGEHYKMRPTEGIGPEFDVMVSDLTVPNGWELAETVRISRLRVNRP